MLRSKRGALSTLALALAMSVIIHAAVTAGNAVHNRSLGGNDVPSVSMDTATGAVTPLLITCVGDYQGAVSASTQTDNQSNAFTPLTASAVTLGPRSLIYYSANATVNATHAFSTTGGISAFPVMQAQVFNGAKATSPFDQQTGATSASSVTTLASGNVTPTEGNELLITCLTINTGDTPTITEAGWAAPIGNGSVGAQSEGGWYSWKIQTSATTEGATWNWATTNPAAITIASFKSASGGGTTPCLRSLLGVGCDDLAAGTTTDLAGEHRSNIAGWLRRFAVHPRQRADNGARSWRVGQIQRANQDNRAAEDQTPISQVLHKAENYTSNISRFASGVRN